MIKGKRELTPDFHDLEVKYSLEKSLEVKLRILGEMLELIPPRYAEFNKVRSNVTHRMRLIRDKIKRRAKREECLRKSRSFFKDDLFSIVLFGEANSGKTYLFNKLCGTNHPSTIRAFETKEPLIGVFEHNGVKLRVVDLPSSAKPVVARVLREADLVIVMPDSERYVDLINDWFVDSPVKVIDELPSDYWSFLGLIVVSLRGEGLVLFNGSTLSDLDLSSALVNGSLKKSDYALLDGDVIQ
jgi:hypothetical protein